MLQIVTFRDEHDSDRIAIVPEEAVAAKPAIGLCGSNYSTPTSSQRRSSPI